MSNRQIESAESGYQEKPRPSEFPNSFFDRIYMIYRMLRALILSIMFILSKPFPFATKRLLNPDCSIRCDQPTSREFWLRVEALLFSGDLLFVIVSLWFTPLVVAPGLRNPGFSSANHRTDKANRSKSYRAKYDKKLVHWNGGKQSKSQDPSCRSWNSDIKQILDMAKIDS